MNPQLEELACRYVLDRLDARERAAFEVRLRHTPELAAGVREIESAFARHIRALPQHEPPAGVLAGLETRLDRLPAVEAPAPAGPFASRWPAIARWGLAAVIAVGVTTLAVQSLRRAPAAGRPWVIFVGLDPGHSTFTELPMPAGRPDADTRFIQLASLAERYWENPGGQPVQLGASASAGHGYALYDPGSRQGFIAIRQLPDATPGKRYRLWMLDPATGRRWDAGLLPLDGAKSGLYSFSVAPGTAAASRRAGFFVTAEDPAAPGSPRPRGQVVLGDRRI